MTGSSQPCSSLEREHPLSSRPPGAYQSLELVSYIYSSIPSWPLGFFTGLIRMLNVVTILSFHLNLLPPCPHFPFSWSILLVPPGRSLEPNFLSHRNQERTQRAHCKNPQSETTLIICVPVTNIVRSIALVQWAVSRIKLSASAGLSSSGASQLGLSH